MATMNFKPKLLLSFRLKINQISLAIWGLIGLMILAGSLALWRQPADPPGFFRDEAGIGYSAYSILKTGKDSWGRPWPLHFKALGDYPPGIYNYLTIPFVAVMGLTELSARMAGIVAAIILVPIVYWFVTTISRDKQLALLSSLIMILNPWFIVQARSGSEPLVALVFILVGLLMWRRWLLSRDKLSLVLVLGCYFLALFTYNAVKPVLFVYHFLFSWYLFPQQALKPMVLVSTASILCAAYLSVFAIPGAAINYESGNIFKKVAEYDRVVEFTREGLEGVPPLISRAFHNKVTDLVLTAAGASLTYINSDFLFFQGGLPTRYKIPYIGNILLASIPFIIVALVEKKVLKSKTTWFWLSWLVVGLIPGVVSINFHPHVKRTFLMFLPLFVLTAAGILEIGRRLPKIKIGVYAVVGLLLAYNFSYFLLVYFTHSRYITVHARSYGYKQAFQVLADLEDQYSAIQIYTLAEAPEIFYFYYRQIEPSQVQALAEGRNNMFDDEYTQWQINQYVFIEQDCPTLEDLELDILYVALAQCTSSLAKKHIQVLDTIKTTDQLPRMIIFEAVPAFIEAREAGLPY